MTDPGGIILYVSSTHMSVLWPFHHMLLQSHKPANHTKQI